MTNGIIKPRFILIGLVLLSACGEGSRPAPSPDPQPTYNPPTIPYCDDLAGTWHNPTIGDTLEILTTCEGTSSLCDSYFTIEEPTDPESITYTIEVIHTLEDTGCLLPGEHSCDAIVGEDEIGVYLGFICDGGGPVIYDLVQ